MRPPSKNEKFHQQPQQQPNQPQFQYGLFPNFQFPSFPSNSPQNITNNDQNQVISQQNGQFAYSPYQMMQFYQQFAQYQQQHQQLIYHPPYRQSHQPIPAQLPPLQPLDSSQTHILQQILSPIQNQLEQNIQRQNHQFQQPTNIIKYPPSPPLQYHMQNQVKQVPKSTPDKVKCENCDKMFDNGKMYQAHIQQHIQCSSCSFSASKRIVLQHQSQEHGTKVQDIGAKGAGKGKPLDAPEKTIKWIKRMDNPEDIEKWIADRKRNYPTDSNIKNKGSVSVSKSKFNQICQTFRKDSTAGREFTSEDCPEKDVGDDSIDYDGEASKSVDEGDHEEDGPEETTAKVPVEEYPQKKKPCKFFMKGSCKHGDSCQYDHPHPSTLSEAQKKKIANLEKSSDTSKSGRKRKRGDLLEILSAQEEKNDRNLVYQAIRYLLSLKNIKDESAISTADELAKDTTDSEISSSTSTFTASDDEISDNEEDDEEEENDNETL